ncbi:MAG: lipoyl(octanoyl) transferase LipB [Ardenticatenaceae bacterium]|nr:lipoyl(octanoyl) transferase LipB [Ardenticatenaceae bacterium]
MSPFWVVDLGICEYLDALDLQRRLVAAKKAGVFEPDVLLLLEHPAVITLGRRGRRENIRVSEETLAALGIPVYTVERAGDVTYHGPGQLVGYPVLDLRHFRKDVGWFVASMQEAVRRTLAEYGVTAYALHGNYAGLWVRSKSQPKLEQQWDEAVQAALTAVVAAQSERKIMAQGARIEEWITFHGFALNVNTNLAHFDLIIPCGIADHGVTSLERELGTPVLMADVKEKVATHFQALFEHPAESRARADIEVALGHHFPSI